VRERQRDFGRALGIGVIEGLGVRPETRNGRRGVVIGAGQGITASGECVMIALDTFVAFDDIDEQQRVNVQLGISAAPLKGTRSRTGLFVLALRPVEFTSNPTPSYPTTLDGTRSVRDGDTIEAVAITLIDYGDRSPANATPQQRRATAAREIFFERSRDGLVQDALPLAMLQFDAGQVSWLDTWLVRREIGTESGLAVTLNPRPRALVEAWFRQYESQLAEVVAERRGVPLASEVFGALPAVGPVPAAAIQWEDGFEAGLRQSFFPPDADIEFSFVPDDELPALLDESLALPPIDLRAADDALDHLGLVIVAPVPRAVVDDIRRNLVSARMPVRMAPAALPSLRSPLHALFDLSALRPAPLLRPLLPIGPAPLPAPPRQDNVDAAWRKAFDTAVRHVQDRLEGNFWYLRRRRIPYSSEVSGYTLRLAGGAQALDDVLEKRLEADGAAASYAAATRKSPLLTRAELLNVLTAPRLAPSSTLEAGRLGASDLLRRAVLAEVQAAAAASGGDIGHDDATRIAGRYAAPRLGEGMARVLAIAPRLQEPALASVVSRSLVVAQLDQVSADLPDSALGNLGADIVKLAEADQPEAIAELVRSRT
jgi:hypothetical protein